MNNKINIYTDGGSRGNPGPAACAFVAIDGSGKMLEKRGKYIGTTTNNIAEYQAVLFAFDWLIQQKKILADYEPTINFYADSRLIISQLNGIFKVKDASIRNLLFAIREKEATLNQELHYHLIPRENNLIADKIVNQVLNQAPLLK